MAWTMTLRHKELVGSVPNRSVRLAIEVTDGVTSFTVDWNFNTADSITLAGIRAAVQNLIDKEADLIAKFNLLDSAMDQPLAVVV